MASSCAMNVSTSMAGADAHGWARATAGNVIVNMRMQVIRRTRGQPANGAASGETGGTAALGGSMAIMIWTSSPSCLIRTS